MSDETLSNKQADEAVDAEYAHTQAVIAAMRLASAAPTPSLDTIENRAVLAVIAAHIGGSATNFRIENEAVFFDAPDGLRCACAIGTPYWLEAVASSQHDQSISSSVSSELAASSPTN